jgi:hypothetical protein
MLAGAGLAALACALALAVFAPSGAAVTGDVMEVSWNWSGYVATGLGSTASTASSTTAFKSVTATWKQPAARCTGTTRSSASAIWVGLGGYSTRSKALEQTGTSADCSQSGKPSYYAWYELVPEPSITIKNFRVQPGDTITASVVVNGTDVLLWLKNRTRNQVFSKHVTLAQPDLTSAEWIAEAPSECTSDGYCRQIPLANFGSVTFTKIAALATIEGLGDQGGTVSSTLWQATPIQLVPDRTERYFGDIVERPDAIAGAAGATPIGLSADGSSFKVSWQAKPTAAGAG